VSGVDEAVNHTSRNTCWSYIITSLTLRLGGCVTADAVWVVCVCCQVCHEHPEVEILRYENCRIVEMKPKTMNKGLTSKYILVGGLALLV